MEPNRMAVGCSGQQRQHLSFKFIPYSIIVTILSACFLTLPATRAASNTTNTLANNGSIIVNDQLLENQISDSFVDSIADQSKEDTIESIESVNHSQEIDINSIDDGLLTADKAGRHHYDRQQQRLVGQKQALVTEKPTAISRFESASVDTDKPESRNQQDQQMEQIIIDHRPLEQQQGDVADHQESQIDSELLPTSEPPQLTSTPVNGAASESNLHPTFASSNSPAPSSTSTTAVRYNQVDTPSTQTSVAGPTTSWRSSPAQFSYSAQQQPQRKTSNQFSQLSSSAQSQPITTMSAATSSFAPIASSSSNQVVTVQQQYPTSINSIINEQQQQQPGQFAASFGQPQAQNQQQVGVSGSPNLIGANQQQPQPQPSQQQMVTLNGQPTSMLWVGPSGTSNGVGGGRRISIAGWLRGISSMLANMFNRRDHGLQLNGQSSNQIGHWIQLGPNAPHWLSQAQTLLHSQQQYQQQVGAASSNKYATFVQTPQQQQQPQTMTITMQPATILTSSGNNQQQAATSPVGSNDLQASSSSPTYALTQIPMQQQVAIAQYNQQPVMSSTPRQPAANQQQQVIIGPPGIVQPQAPGLQTVSTRQAGTQQAEQQQQVDNKQASLAPTTTQASASVAQSHQQQQHGLQAANADNYQRQSITWSTPVVSYQQLRQAASTSAPQIQTRHTNKSPTLVVADSNLPLAHYSRFASSSSSSSD